MSYLVCKRTILPQVLRAILLGSKTLEVRPCASMAARSRKRLANEPLQYWAVHSSLPCSTVRTVTT